MTSPVTGLDPAGYLGHQIHSDERIWTETNCAVDVWVELLHALGLDPVAGLAFTLSADFDGMQWTFVKYPLEELRELYGIDVTELNVWRPLPDHIVEHLDAGRLLTVEVDSWHLPDTAGVSYGSNHEKSTIVPGMIDPGRKQLHYFHNRGYHELTGPDYDGVFPSVSVPAGDDSAAPVLLPPYVEVVRIDGTRTNRPVDADLVRRLVREHLKRRPADKPAARLATDVSERVEWLQSAGTETFHKYAFATVRQFGATAELAADLVDWLDARDGGCHAIAEQLRQASETARTAQLMLARAARGRTSRPDEVLAAMAGDWTSALDALSGIYG